MKKTNDEESYQTYMADCLQMLSKNLAHTFGGGWVDKRLYEITHRKPASKSTPEEQFYQVIKNLGITLTGGGNDCEFDGLAD